MERTYQAGSTGQTIRVREAWYGAEATLEVSTALGPVRLRLGEVSSQGDVRAYYGRPDLRPAFDTAAAEWVRAEREEREAEWARQRAVWAERKRQEEEERAAYRAKVEAYLADPEGMKEQLLSGVPPFPFELHTAVVEANLFPGLYWTHELEGDSWQPGIVREAAEGEDAPEAHFGRPVAMALFETTYTPEREALVAAVRSGAEPRVRRRAPLTPYVPYVSERMRRQQERDDLRAQVEWDLKTNDNH